MDSPPAATASRRSAGKRRRSGDDMPANQKTAATPDANDIVGVRRSKRRTSSIVVTTTPNPPSTKKGKARARTSITAPQDDEIYNSEDEVEEYQFSSDEEDLEEDEDDFDDARSVISLSSSISEDSESKLLDRPWKDFSIHMRQQWELMYANVTTYPIGGSWEVTEDYQREKDAEMLRYMEDFPLNQWTITHEEANQAYYRLLERTRWRSLGIRIYGRERIPEWIPGSTNSNRQKQGLNAPRDKVSRDSSRSSEQPRPTPRPIEPRQGDPSRPNEPPRPGEPPRGPMQPSDQPRPTPLQQPMPMNMPIQQQHPPQQHPPLPPHPQHLQHPPPQMQMHPLPPPPHALPSQPNAQPIPVPPGPQPHPQHQHHPGMGMGRPVGPPQHIPYGMPPGFPPHGYPPNGFPPVNQPKPRRGREKKESPVNNTPPPPPPTPPYVLRHKPVDKKPSKIGQRRNARRQAEADEFPWTRQLNFKEVKDKAGWDDSVYDAKTLEEMDATRSRNIPIIDELDAKVQEQQRIARAAKKAAGGKGESDGETKPPPPPPPPAPAEGEKMQRGKRKGETGGDPYHSGLFAFATDEDEKRALALGFKTPDEVIEAGTEGKVDPDVQAAIKIYWNPGKKGMTENLEQVKYSVKDTVVTRKQLEKTPVLTKRAAECVIDFCPDMLWRGMLLRICSEAGYGNKDVRDRFCYNGCYCDKATITKRISAALGQKQVQPKSKGYAPGEWEWYDQNVKDFAMYIDFFGKRTSHRNMLKIQMQGEKRKKQRVQVSGGQEESGDDKGGPSKVSDEAGHDTDMADADAEDGDGEGEEGHESDATDDSNAVSVQDSDILDKIED